MVTGYIFTAFLIILGLAVMRFGSIHFKKFKEGKTKIKSKLSGQLSFLILLIVIIGLIVYSINDLLFKYNGTTVFKLSSAGAVVASDNITAFGSP